MTPFGRSVVPDVYIRREQFVRRPQIHGRGGSAGGECRGVDLRRLVQEDRRGNIFDRGGEFGVREQKLRVRIADDVFDLVGGEPKIDRQEHGAEMARSESELEKSG